MGTRLGGIWSIVLSVDSVRRNLADEVGTLDSEPLEYDESFEVSDGSDILLSTPNWDSDLFIQPVASVMPGNLPRSAARPFNSSKSRI